MEGLDLIIIMVIAGLCLTFPVKCYNDGQVKLKCLELHGSIKETDSHVSCDLGEKVSK